MSKGILDLREQLRQGKVSRRDFVRLAALLGLSVSAAEVLAACAPGPLATPLATPCLQPPRAGL